MKKNTSFKAMLATISLLGIVPVTVNAFSNQTVVPFAKTELVNVITERTVKGENAGDPDSLLAELVVKNDTLILNDVVVAFFEKATETRSGSAVIASREGSNYVGTVGITISSLPKIELSSVITATTIKGEKAINPDMLIKEIGLVNPRLTTEDIEIKDFNAATPISNGSATIVAKEDTKYSGEVAITLSAMPKIDINDVIRIREVAGELANDEDNVLAKVAELNIDLDINDVEIDEFKAASEAAPGAATIVALADTKYVGEVSIVITAIPKTQLGTVITERTISGSEANTSEAVFAKIAELNPELNVESVEVRAFTRATDITPGSAIISAKANSKYTGQVGITITPLTDTFKSQESNDKDVVDAINNTKFSKSVNFGSKANDVSAVITGSYIKARLSDDLEFNFNDNSFELKGIFKKSGGALTDRDLSGVKEIDARIYYNYGTINNQFADIIITVKEITRTSERNILLTDIKTKADRDEDDNEWSELWMSYFKRIELDIKTFSFQFPIEVLESLQANKYKAVQAIIYDEIKLVMETDFRFWGIDKGYDPTSVIVKYEKFELDEDNNTFLAKGRVSINIRAYGEYVKHSVRFNYSSPYIVV